MKLFGYNLIPECNKTKQSR